MLFGAYFHIITAKLVVLLKFPGPKLIGVPQAFVLMGVAEKPRPLPPPFGTRRFSRICAETCTGHGCCSIRPVQVFSFGFPSTDGHSWHVLVDLPTIAYCPRIPSLYTQLSGTLCSLSGLLP